jgi:aarF domain-containing kinase
MLQGYAQIYARQIGDLLLRMPRPLLLLLKTNDCLRSVDLSLGAPVNTFIITAATCSRALAELQQQEHPGLASWLSSSLEGCRVRLAMQAMRAMGTWTALQRAVLGRQGGPAGSRGVGSGGVVYSEDVLAQHRRAAEAGVVLSAAQADGAAAAAPGAGAGAAAATAA